MDIIVPEKKKRPALAWLAAMLAAGTLLTGAFFLYRYAASQRPEPESAAAPAAPQETPEQRDDRLKLESLEREIEGLGQALLMAEEFADRPKYLEIARVSAQKGLEADKVWERLEASRHGLRDGLSDGIFETWQKRFTSEQKYQMLAEESGLSPEKVRLLKAEIEVFFAEEFFEKYGSPPADGSGADPEAEESALEDAAPSPEQH